jgi:hypothetical protein
MPYGTIKVDTITFTDAGVDKSVSISGLVQNPTFTGNVTATGTISGLIVQAPTVTGTTANFASGVYTTQISGAIVKVPAGGAGAPSIQVGVGASVAPGLYGAGTDLLGISTGGAGRIFIDSTGRLGVGTSSPAQVLDVAGNGRFFVNAGSPTVSVNNGTIDHYIGVNATGGLVGTSNSYPVLFLTNNTERLRIDSSGNVGIGTTSPGALLDVRAGSLHVGSDYVSTLNTDYRIRLRSVGAASNNNYLVELGASGSGPQPADSDLTINTQTWNGSAYVITEKMRVTATGNVGIGTTSPSLGLLEVSSANGVTLAIKNTTGTTVGTEFCQLTFNNTSNANANFESAKIKAISTNGGSNLAHLTFENSGTERARIDSSGRVGIGTSSPAEVLHVNGNLALDNGVLNTPKYLTFRANSTGAEYGGIRWFNLQWNGNIRASITSASDGAVFNGYLAFSTGSSGNDATEKMRIDSSGRVGIGTSSPGSLLDVRFPTSPATDNGDGFNTLRVWTSSALAADTGGAISLGGVNATGGAASSFGQIAGRKVNATSADYAGYLQFSVNDLGGTMFEAMRIDSSGRVGINNTGPGTILDVGDPGTGLRFINGAGGNLNIGLLGGTSSVDSYIYQRANGPLLFGTNNAERLRIDSSGRLLVGSSTARSLYGQTGVLQTEGTGYASSGVNIILNNASTAGPLLMLGKSRGSANGSNTIVQNGDTLGEIYFCGADGTDLDTPGAGIRAVVDGAPGSNDMPSRLEFSTTADGAAVPTERMRITQGGGLKASTNGSYGLLSAPNAHEFVQASPGSAAFHAYHSATSGQVYGYYFQFTNQNPNDTTAYVFTSLDNTNANIYTIWSNGTVTARSDAKFKKNIETTRNGYLEDLAQLRVVKYNWYNHEDGTPKELGFIAQEVEQVFPGLVSTAPDKDDQGNETGEVSKSIKTSVFTPMLVKALQEALERIKTLEAKVAALEGN